MSNFKLIFKGFSRSIFLSTPKAAVRSAVCLLSATHLLSPSGCTGCCARRRYFHSIDLVRSARSAFKIYSSELELPKASWATERSPLWARSWRYGLGRKNLKKTTNFWARKGPKSEEQIYKNLNLMK